jgi:hypothetical protein
VPTVVDRDPGRHRGRRRAHRAGYTVRTDDSGLVVDDRRAVEAPDDVAVELVRAGIPPVRLVADGEDLEAFFLRVVGVHDA